VVFRESPFVCNPPSFFGVTCSPFFYHLNCTFSFLGFSTSQKCPPREELCVLRSSSLGYYEVTTPIIRLLTSFPPFVEIDQYVVDFFRRVQSGRVGFQFGLPSPRCSKEASFFSINVSPLPRPSPPPPTPPSPPPRTRCPPPYPAPSEGTPAFHTFPSSPPPFFATGTAPRSPCGFG